ncbi:hypothetical protein M0804_014600 [Polistes exclamans]|nr:hypothetical protein M0804_014600 [Polistes exclamans]
MVVAGNCGPTGATTAARRRYLRTRRGGDLARIRACLEDRREKRRILVRAIRRAKASAGKEFIATIKDDPWGRPYKLVMGKLRARVAPNVNVGDPDEIVVTVEEVRRAAKRIDLWRATGPDGTPGLVVKRAAMHCSRGLAKCFTMLLRSGVFQRAWKRAKLVLLKKRVLSSAPHFGILLTIGSSESRCRGGSRVVFYADDTALLLAGRDLSCALLAAERDLEVLVSEIEGLGLKVALQKTEAIAYPASALRRRKIAPPPVIKYRGPTLRP